jgi:hypothetical protein
VSYEFYRRFTKKVKLAFGLAPFGFLAGGLPFDTFRSDSDNCAQRGGHYAF